MDTLTVIGVVIAASVHPSIDGAKAVETARYEVASAVPGATIESANVHQQMDGNAVVCGEYVAGDKHGAFAVLAIDSGLRGRVLFAASPATSRLAGVCAGNIVHTE